MVLMEAKDAIVMPISPPFTLHIVSLLLAITHSRELWEVTFNNRPRNEI